ncbi:hypothetical protein S83_048873 [Arachis hypogaea]
MREEEVASVAAKPSLAGLGSPSPSPLASGSPLCFCCNSPLSWPAWKEACATLEKLLSDSLLVKAAIQHHIYCRLCSLIWRKQ